MSNAPIAARLVRMVDDQMIREDFGPQADLIAAMEIRGFVFTSSNFSGRQRAELQGQPRFAGLLGPMWDGDAIRYECAESNAMLSS